MIKKKWIIDIDFVEEIKEILKDNQSGSRTILKRINAFFLKRYDAIEDINSILDLIARESQSFENIQSYIKGLRELHRNVGLDKDYFKRFEINIENSDKMIFRKIMNRISQKSCLLTLSNSSTVLNALEGLAKADLIEKVVISESRPINEGQLTAKELLSKNIKVDYILEAQLPNYIEQCDAAILGADAILNSGDVINKTGSKLIALLCNIYNKPLYILTEKTKFKRDDDYFIESKNCNEIWNFEHPLLSINNHYFEIVPRDLLTEIITD